MLFAVSVVFLQPFFIRAYRHFVPPETTVAPVRTVRVTFPEGFTVYDISQRLEEKGVCNGSDFIAASNSPSFVDEIWSFENEDDRAYLLEGYLFPDTYEFYFDEKPQKALNKLLINFKSKFNDEFKLRADELGYSTDDIVTIASIVQQEANTKEEMGKVSSVIHNRLNSYKYPGIQCDVTIVYVNQYITPFFEPDEVEQFAKLYNTYRFRGLPAGPITNPGLDAIKAALYPDDTDYYFFVTDKSGNYYYAETFSAHNKNCKTAGVTIN